MRQAISGTADDHGRPGPDSGQRAAVAEAAAFRASMDDRAQDGESRAQD
ncbi:hypothetical protein ACF068_29320 [Streptomyces sp. NPDC016309]